MMSLKSLRTPRVAAALVALAMLRLGTVAQAEDITHGGTTINMDFVTVGNPGNAGNTIVMFDGTTGYGAVGYTYQMGKYEVTASQYSQFLNAVAKTDTYGLYFAGMGPPYFGNSGIIQGGSSGNYTYSVSAGSANFPAAYVS